LMTRGFPFLVGGSQLGSERRSSGDRFDLGEVSSPLSETLCCSGHACPSARAIKEIEKEREGEMVESKRVTEG
jgi:hypothetical protein